MRWPWVKGPLLDHLERSELEESYRVRHRLALDRCEQPIAQDAKQKVNSANQPQPINLSHRRVSLNCHHGARVPRSTPKPKRSSFKNIDLMK